MLTSQDLLVLRAALTFWYEEMGLYNAKAIAEYAGVDTYRLTIAESEIKDLATRLRNSDVRYAIACVESGTLVDTMLLTAPPVKALTGLAIATVLTPVQGA
jgi:hypothetical protein